MADQTSDALLIKGYFGPTPAHSKYASDEKGNPVSPTRAFMNEYKMLTEDDKKELGSLIRTSGFVYHSN